MGSSKRKQRAAQQRTRFDENTGTEVPVSGDESASGALGAADDETAEDALGATDGEAAEAIIDDSEASQPDTGGSVADTVTPHDFEAADGTSLDLEPQDATPGVDSLSSAVDPPTAPPTEEVVQGEPLATAVFEEPPEGLPPDPPGTPPQPQPQPQPTTGKKGDDKPTTEQRAMVAFNVGMLIDAGLEKILERFMGGPFLTPVQFAQKNGGIPFDIDPMALARMDLQHAQITDFTYVVFEDASGAKGQTAFPGHTFQVPPGCKLVSANVLPATPGMAAVWQLSESGVSLGGLQKPVMKFLKENQELLRGIAATASLVYYLYKVWQQAAQNPAQITK